MPKSPTTTMKLILQYYEDQCALLKIKLVNQINEGTRMSITVDEWTSIKFQRYLNVTIHTNNDFYHIFMMFIEGVGNAITISELVVAKLKDFGITMASHIVASTHDGAAVMVKYGRLNGTLSQLCYNHCLHLAVLDVFYRKVTNVNIIELKNNQFENESSDEEDNFSNELFELDLSINNIQLNADIGDILKEARKLIKFFRSKLIRRNNLSDRIMELTSEKSRLVLDCKTRWNSLIPMLSRLVKFELPIKKSLEDLGSIKLYNPGHFAIYRNLLSVLEPLEHVVNELSNSSTNLLRAEGALIFLLDVLEKKSDDYSRSLYGSLKKRIMERRNTDIISLYKYLHTGWVIREGQILEFPYSSKKNIMIFANNLFDRLFKKDTVNIENNTSIVSTVENNDVEIINQFTTPSNELLSEMNKRIKTVLEDKNDNIEINTSNSLEKDFELFENFGTRSDKLEKLYMALSSIQPTSTSSERVFSIASNFCTKQRNSLNPHSLNALVFLKYYFIKIKQQ